MEPADFETLLQVQTYDSEVDQLSYRREHLSSHEVLESIQRRAAALRPEMNKALATRDEAAEQQASLELEISTIESRMGDINARLYGSIPMSSKDAQVMSGEVSHLKDRRTSLEDQELEVMELLEPAQAEVEKYEAAARELATELQATRAEIAAGQAEIDHDLERLRGLRQQAANGLPASLLAEYDRLRASFGGVGVAKLTGNACGGCHLTLAAAEVDRVRKALDHEVMHCDECGRILVR